MLEILGTFGLTSFLVVTAIVGLRVLALTARTGRAAEVAIGTCLIVGGLFGYLPETLAVSTNVFPDAAVDQILLATQLTIRIAALAMVIFSWQVFRRNALWAHVLVGIFVVLLVGSAVAFPLHWRYATTARDILWADVFIATRTAAFLWATLEAFHEAGRARSRFRLGLGDAIVARRFHCWGLAFLCGALLCLSPVLGRSLSVSSASPAWVFGESILGLIAAGSLLIAFSSQAAPRERPVARPEAS